MSRTAAVLRAIGEGAVALVVVALYVVVVGKVWHRVPDERVALAVFFGVPVAVILAALGLEALRRRH